MTKMPVPADHAAHDQLLVAIYAAGDATGDELARASALVANCPDCAALHRDLRSISSALTTAPAPARPRDFRLTAEQAAALSRPTGWRRILAPLSGARSAAGPLAASLTALGVAGLLLGGGVNLGFGGSATSALAPQAASSGGDTAVISGQGAFNGYSASSGAGVSGANDASAAASQEAAPVPSAAPSAAPVDVPSAAASAAASQVAAVASSQSMPSGGPLTPQTTDKNASGGSAAEATAPASTEGANMAPVRPAATPAPQAAVADTPAGPSPLVLGSLALLVAGVVLGILRLAARRLV